MRLTGRQGCLSVQFILPCLPSSGDRWASLPWRSLPLSPVGLTRTVDSLSLSLAVFLSLSLSHSCSFPLPRSVSHGHTWMHSHIHRHSHTHHVPHLITCHITSPSRITDAVPLVWSSPWPYALLHRGEREVTGGGVGGLQADAFIEHIL